MDCLSTDVALRRNTPDYATGVECAGLLTALNNTSRARDSKEELSLYAISTLGMQQPDCLACPFCPFYRFNK